MLFKGELVVADEVGVVVGPEEEGLADEGVRGGQGGARDLLHGVRGGGALALDLRGGAVARSGRTEVGEVWANAEYQIIDVLLKRIFHL